MFSWIASKPAAKEEPPVPKSFDPLKGLGGAVAYYKGADSQAADAAASGKLIGSAAAFYANVARERLLEAADAAVPAGSNPSAGNNSTAEICPGVGEINEFLRRGRRCIDSVAPSLADAGEGKAEGGSSMPAPELDLRFGSAAEEPVRWLFKVVIGSEHADLDAIVSAIVYAFFLDHSEPPSARAAGLCLLPLVHTSRADFHLRTDAAWLLQAMGVDTQALLFLDEVDLRKLHGEGRLQMVLYGHNKMPATIEGMEKAVAEIIPRETGTVISHPIFPRTAEEGSSCATMLARRLSEEAPHLLLNTALARLLLAAILTCTNNLDPGQSSEVDASMAAFLAVGSRCLGRNVFYEILRDKKYNQASLTTEELLRADIVQHAMGPGVRGKKGGEVLNVAISNVGSSTSQLVNKDAKFEEILKQFLSTRSLHLLVILSTYYSETSKRFKRELVLATPLTSLSSGLSFFLQKESHDLRLRPVTIRGMPNWLKAFTLGNPSFPRALAVRMAISKGFQIFIVLLTTATVVSGAKKLKDGSRCLLSPTLKPIVECEGGPATCLVSRTPKPGNPYGRYKGVCNSTYEKGLYCAFMSQPYAVGTRGILGSSSCERCNCKAVPVVIPGGKQLVRMEAQCVCPEVQCRTNYRGASIRRFACPPLQQTCLINRVGRGGVDSEGYRIDVGTCIAPQDAFRATNCSSAGPTWGMKWYALGTTNIPKPGDWCTRCKCGHMGLIRCRKVTNCTPPPGKSATG
ncbi:unnamed protein product [Closterium sp. NIES-53]